MWVRTHYMSFARDKRSILKIIHSIGVADKHEKSIDYINKVAKCNTSLI